jgi:hypothetical protein
MMDTRTLGPNTAQENSILTQYPRALDPDAGHISLGSWLRTQEIGSWRRTNNIGSNGVVDLRDLGLLHSHTQAPLGVPSFSCPSFLGLEEIAQTKRKEKKMKHNYWWVLVEVGPTLMGLAATGPKAILGSSRGKTQLNIFSMDVTA